VIETRILKVSPWPTVKLVLCAIILNPD
jgi:hypothetical protein